MYELLRGNGEKELELIQCLPAAEYGKDHAIRSAEIARSLRKNGKHVEPIDVFIAAMAIENDLDLFACDKGFGRIPGLKARIF